MDTEKVTTRNFTIPAGKVLFSLLSAYGKFWVAFAIAGIFIFIILGICLNPVWFVVLLMWIFMAAPMLMTFLYFFYGLSPLSSSNSIDHYIIFSPQQTTINFLKTEDDKQSITHSIEINNTEIERFLISPGFLYLQGKAKQGLLIVPLNVVEPSDFKTLRSFFRH